MGKFNEYSQKATPADNDTLMIYDATAKANKLSPFSGIWNWIVGKLANAVINNLQTNDKTVIGAINELNSNRAFGTLITSEGHDCNNLGFGIFLLLNPKNGVTEINWHVVISANNNGAQTGFQITYDLTDGSKAYTRTQASGIWSDWVFINSNPLSILTRSAILLEQAFDYNELKTTGAYYLTGSDPALAKNRPADCTNCYMLVFALIPTRVCQIILPGNDDRAWIRSTVTDSSEWRSWVAIF